MRTIHDIDHAIADLNGDPETRCNKDRAAEGAILCDFMEVLTGADETEHQLSDALCQLMHFCHASRFDFAAALTTAQINFEDEIDEEAA